MRRGPRRSFRAKVLDRSKGEGHLVRLPPLLERPPATLGCPSVLLQRKGEDFPIQGEGAASPPHVFLPSMGFSADERVVFGLNHPSKAAIARQTGVDPKFAPIAKALGSCGR